MNDPCEKERIEKEKAQAKYQESVRALENHKLDPLNQRSESPDKYNEIVEELEKKVSENKLFLVEKEKELTECEENKK